MCIFCTDGVLDCANGSSAQTFQEKKQTQNTFNESQTQKNKIDENQKMNQN